MTTQATDAEATSALTAEYQRLALLANNGDAAAAKLLMATEDRIDAMARRERRNAAAAIEVQRLAGEAAEKVTANARAADEQHHATVLEQREAAFAQVEDATGKLANAVQLALAVDAEVWAASMRLGWSPETRTASRITNFVSTALGREGAGLSDMPSVLAGLREKSLVRTITLGVDVVA